MSEWLRDSFNFCRTYWWAIVTLVVPIAGIRELIMIQTDWYTISQDFTNQTDQFAVSIAAMLIIEPFLYISLILLVRAILSNQYQSYTQRSWHALVVLPKYLLMIFISAFAIGSVFGIAVFVAGAFGGIVVAIPCIYVLVRWLLAGYLLVINNQSPVNALVNSWNVSKGYGWDLLFGMIVTALIGALPSLFMIDGVDSSVAMLSNSVLSIVSSCLGAWSVVFFYRAFDYIQANPRIAE